MQSYHFWVYNNLSPNQIRNSQNIAKVKPEKNGFEKSPWNFKKSFVFNDFELVNFLVLFVV